MSATLDSALFANYFGGCPVLTAGGRTFPVEHNFLEDVYEATGYRLDADGPTAFRGKNDRTRRHQLQNTASSRNRAVVQVENIASGNFVANIDLHLVTLDECPVACCQCLLCLGGHLSLSMIPCVNTP